MEGCIYQVSGSLRCAGHDFMIGRQAAARMYAAYHPEAHSTLPVDEFVDVALGATVDVRRYESYMFDASRRQEPIAALIMAAELDYHRGMVSVPLVCYINPEYRGLSTVIRWLASRQRYVGQALGCRWLMRMKHLSDTSRLITYKEL